MLNRTIDTDVLEAMRVVALQGGNSSSVHALGQRARCEVDDAADALRAWLKAPQTEVVFVSGPEEAKALCHGIQAYLDLSDLAWRGEIDFFELNAEAAYIGVDALGGPSGIGAIIFRKGISLDPLWGGGGQQKGWRSGSLPTALIVGMGAVAKKAMRAQTKEAR